MPPLHWTKGEKVSAKQLEEELQELRRLTAPSFNCHFQYRECHQFREIARKKVRLHRKWLKLATFNLFSVFFLLCCLCLSSEAGLMSQDNSSDKAVYTTQGYSGEAKFVFRSTMKWIDPLFQSVCGRRERKNSV